MVNRQFLVAVNGMKYCHYNYAEGNQTIGNIGGLKVVSKGNVVVSRVEHVHIDWQKTANFEKLSEL